MSFEDDATDDPAGFRPPPHPDDRLWRHPSELRGAQRALPAPAPHHRWGTAAVAVAGVVLVAAGVSVMALGLRERAAQNDPVQQAAFSLNPDPSADLTTSFLGQPEAGHVELAERLAPTVVRVDNGGVRASGVVVRDDGLVLTTADVVAPDRQALVALADGRLLPATTVGADPLTGLALLDLPGDGYIHCPLADLPFSDVGSQPALAMGVDESGRLMVASGEIEATPTIGDRNGAPDLDGVLAIGAVTEPAGRGGPVVDEDGMLLGVTTWSDASRSYAAPTAMAQKVVDDLLAAGRVDHTWLGITGTNATNEVGPAGVLVREVPSDGPAAAVLRPDDVIVAVDQQLVSDMSDLVFELRRHDPGDVVQVTYRRNGTGAVVTAPVTLDARPPDLD